MEKVNGSFTYMKCDNYGKFIAFSIIALLSYLFGLYLFRFTYPEYLVTLIEKVQSSKSQVLYTVLFLTFKVFLDFADNHGKFSQKKLLLDVRYIH